MKMGSVITKGNNIRQILANVSLFQSFGGQIGDTGVTVVNGRKMILAGTPVGGTNDFYEDEQAVLIVSNDSDAKGVLLHDVDVTDGTANGTVLVFGFVNINRVDPTVVISAAAKTALDGKVMFVKRNL